METSAMVREISGTTYVYIPRWMAAFAGEHGGRFRVTSDTTTAEVDTPIRRSGHAFRIPLYKREKIAIENGTPVRVQLLEGWVQ